MDCLTYVKGGAGRKILQVCLYLSKHCDEDTVFPLSDRSLLLDCESAEGLASENDVNKMNTTMDLQYLIKFSVITNLTTHSKMMKKHAIRKPAEPIFKAFLI